jgi:hypothetical protein
MATKSTCSVEIECWKEHTCVGCGTVFRYRMKRKRVGEGPTEKAAEIAARQAMMTDVAQAVEMQPCPACGLYQPDMAR